MTAIVALPEPEGEKLAEWFEQWREAEWDRQMEADFSPGGRGSAIIRNTDHDIDQGRFASFDADLLAHRRP